MNTLKYVGVKALETSKIKTLMVGYTTLPDEAKELAIYFNEEEEQKEKEVILTRLGAALGTQVGPGCFGIAWIGDFDKDWLKTATK